MIESVVQTNVAADWLLDFALWVPWLLGLVVWLIARRVGADRRRAARSSATLALLWFAMGLAARLDPRSRDFFVYVGLGVNACVLASFFATLPRDSWNLTRSLLGAAGVGIAVVPVMQAWPTLTIYLGRWDAPTVNDLVKGMLPSSWLPWCSRSFSGVALAAMATSASTAFALACVAREPAQGDLPRGVRIESAIGLVGSVLLFAIHVAAILAIPS